MRKMRRTTGRLFYGLLVFGITSFTGPIVAPLAPAAAASEACQSQVDKALARLEVTTDEIREISIIPRRQSYHSGWVTKGYDAWVRLKNCQGALILDYDFTCRERQVYTRGDCRVTGVKDY